VLIGQYLTIIVIWSAMTEEIGRYRAGFSRVIGLARRL
jgi:hypothetical protein